MKVRELLQQCREQQITLFLTDQGRIGYRAPEGTMTERLKTRLREHEQDLIHLLKSANADRRHRLRVFSHVLGRKVAISWMGANPKVVHVDRTPYSLDEIAKLKGASLEEAKKVHLLKETFNGKIVDEDQDHQ